MESMNKHDATELKKKQKFKLSNLHPYALIFLLIIISTILTYIIPAGVYERIEDESGRMIVQPDNFSFVKQTPVSPFRMVQAIPEGMLEVGWIIFLIFIIGGSFGIINKTGAIEAGLNASIKKAQGKGKFLIIILMVVFSLGGATFGLAESTLIFIPICIMLAQALGYDSIVGMAIVNIGAVCGFAAGWMNIFTVGVAQGIAELPLFSGLWYRLITHAVVLVIAIAYTTKYAKKVQQNPSLSFVYESDKQVINNDITSIAPDAELTPRKKGVLVVIAVGFIALIFGITHGWSTGTHISSLFLVMGIVCGYVAGLTTSEIADAFIDGAKSIVFGALLVGLCRAMVVILEEGQTIDTILYFLAGLLRHIPKVLAAGLMVVVQTFVNFLVNSGSGQAATTMPIMAPLADILGISRQTAVLAFQYGDGLSNSLWPTSGILMAGLSIAKIPYDRWIKFAGKLILILYIAVIILTMFSVVIGYK